MQRAPTDESSVTTSAVHLQCEFCIARCSTSMLLSPANCSASTLAQCCWQHCALPYTTLRMHNAYQITKQCVISGLVLSCFAVGACVTACLAARTCSWEQTQRPWTGHSCSTAIPDPFDIGSITCTHSFTFLSACVFVLQWQAQLSIIPQQFQLSVSLHLYVSSRCPVRYHFGLVYVIPRCTASGCCFYANQAVRSADAAPRPAQLRAGCTRCHHHRVDDKLGNFRLQMWFPG